MLLSEIEVAGRLGHAFFNGPELSDTTKKKRVRRRAREANVKPVVKKHNIWLFHEDDIVLLTKCHSRLVEEKDRHSGRSRARSRGNAYEKVQALLTDSRPN